ncbi:MAG: hypothetical protein OXC60_11990 [Litoreibacter sp.]|nr:hypothetical protein [Litoreibacter sp.]MCY4335374.1 hypothetical protein [Litoreibacter sp.]
MSWGFCAVAKDVPPMVLDTLTVVSSVKAPPWVSEGSVEAQSEIAREQGRAENGHDFFRWFSIPKGESFSDWSQHYAIRAERPLFGDLRLYANGEISRALGDCDDGAVQFATPPPENALVFAVFCTESRTRPGTGRVGFFNLTLAGDTLVQNVLQLRVPNFSLSNGLTPETRMRLRDGLRFVGAMHVSY